ncbi:hypothetical protein UA70_13390, partial [Raoultella planticola]
ELFTLREDLFLEVEETLNDMLHSSVSFLGMNYGMTKITVCQCITAAENRNRYSNGIYMLQPRSFLRGCDKIQGISRLRQRNGCVQSVRALPPAR